MEEGGTHVIIRQVSACPSPKASSTIHIDMPNKKDGTLTKVPVTLHMPKEMMVTDTQSKTAETVTPSSLLPLTMDDINVDDFMDVVTTYKCKFCAFNSPWKSGLISHIRCSHLLYKPLTAANGNLQPLVPVPNLNQEPVVELQLFKAEKHRGQEESNQIPPAIVAPPSAANAQETHLFLCGQCHQGFDCFDNCKNHILTVHQAIVEGEEPAKELPSPASPQPKAKIPRKPRKKLVRYEILADAAVPAKEVEPETLGKRRVRPPRALREDYLVTSDKRKYVKRQPKPEESDPDPIHSGVFKCEIRGCQLSFQTPDKRDYHTRCHPETTEDLAPSACFQCPECPTEFRPRLASWAAMGQHLWKSHQIDLDMLSCNVCSFRASNQIRLDNHRRMHCSKSSFTCTTVGCGKSFRHPGLLRKHRLAHRFPGTATRPSARVTCEKCRRWFVNDRSMRKHVAAVHQNHRPFVCPICLHACARRSMLVLHSRQHTGEKPFACDSCDYTSCDHNSLRRHKMRHSGERPYKCPHCSYACIQAISYKTHLRSKHPGMDGIYECTLCTFRSVSKENYVNHVGDHQLGLVKPTEVIELTPTPPPPTVKSTLSDDATTQLLFSCLGVLARQQQSSDNTIGSIEIQSRVTASDDTFDERVVATPSEGVEENFDAGNPQTITFQIPEGYDLDELERAQLAASNMPSIRGEPIYLTIEQSTDELNDQGLVGQLVAEEHVVSTVNERSNQSADDESAEASYQLISIANNYT